MVFTISLVLLNLIRVQHFIKINLQISYRKKQNITFELSVQILKERRSCQLTAEMEGVRNFQLIHSCILKDIKK